MVNISTRVVVISYIQIREMSLKRFKNTERRLNAFWDLDGDFPDINVCFQEKFRLE